MLHLASMCQLPVRRKLVTALVKAGAPLAVSIIENIQGHTLAAPDALLPLGTPPVMGELLSSNR